ncbi:cytochrome c oxidase assembly factor Coa1 family protein [Pyxidicoccus sp. 3LG]
MSPPHRDSPWARLAARWLVPAALVLGGLGCFAGGVTWVLRSLYLGMEQELRRDDVHRLALRTAEASPRATELLGAPLASSALTLRAHGSTEAAGLVDFDLAVQGPRGRGVLQVQVAYTPHVWTLRRLVLRPEGGGEVELPSGDSTPARPPD